MLQQLFPARAPVSLPPPPLHPNPFSAPLSLSDALGKFKFPHTAGKMMRCFQSKLEESRLVCFVPVMPRQSGHHVLLEAPET